MTGLFVNTRFASIVRALIRCVDHRSRPSRRPHVHRSLSSVAEILECRRLLTASAAFNGSYTGTLQPGNIVFVFTSAAGNTDTTGNYTTPTSSISFSLSNGVLTVPGNKVSTSTVQTVGSDLSVQFTVILSVIAVNYPTEPTFSVPVSFNISISPQLDGSVKSTFGGWYIAPTSVSFNHGTMSITAADRYTEFAMTVTGGPAAVLAVAASDATYDSAFEITGTYSGQPPANNAISVAIVDGKGNTVLKGSGILQSGSTFYSVPFGASATLGASKYVVEVTVGTFSATGTVAVAKAYATFDPKTLAGSALFGDRKAAVDISLTSPVPPPTDTKLSLEIFDNTYSLKYSNGHFQGTVEVPPGTEAGSYPGTLNFSGDANLSKSVNNYKLDIGKDASEIALLDTLSITYGEKLSIKGVLGFKNTSQLVDAPDGVAVNISLTTKVNGTNQTLSDQATIGNSVPGGFVAFLDTRNLPAGIYTVYLSYKGDKNHLPATPSEYLQINYAQPKIVILNPKPITTLDTSVTITCAFLAPDYGSIPSNESVIASALMPTNGSTKLFAQTVKIGSDGTFTFTIPLSGVTPLLPVILMVSYGGDNNYKPDKLETVFVVLP